MQMSYSNFEQGEIVVGELYYSDLTGVKKRPLLVISSSEFNNKSDDVMLLKITGGEHQTPFSIGCLQSDLEKGELKKESRISTDFITTLSKGLLGKPIAKISSKKLKEVTASLAKIMDI